MYKVYTGLEFCRPLVRRKWEVIIIIIIAYSGTFCKQIWTELLTIRRNIFSKLIAINFSDNVSSLEFI